MTKNDYPPHHEDARPLYLEIPQDEYDRIMTENLSMKETLRKHTKFEIKIDPYYQLWYRKQKALPIFEAYLYAEMRYWKSELKNEAER